jgi:hypothetical protein
MRRTSLAALVILLAVPSARAGDETAGNRSIHIVLGSRLSLPVIELAAWVPETGRPQQDHPEVGSLDALHRILLPGEPTDPQLTFPVSDRELGVGEGVSAILAGTTVHAAPSGGGAEAGAANRIDSLDESPEGGERSPRGIGSSLETPWDDWENRDSTYDGWDYRDGYDR